MPSLTSYLVVPARPGNSRLLVDFTKDAAEGDPEALVVDRVVGDPAAPARLVVRATEEAIRALEDRYRGELLIEPDLSLRLS